MRHIISVLLENEPGALSRVVGWMYGSAATFAVGKSASAPGQITVEQLRALLTRGRARELLEPQRRERVEPVRVEVVECVLVGHRNGCIAERSRISSPADAAAW